MESEKVVYKPLIIREKEEAIRYVYDWYNWPDWSNWGRRTTKENDMKTPYLLAEKYIIKSRK